MYLNTRASVAAGRAPRVPHQIFLGISWAGTAITFFLVLARLYIRQKSQKRIFTDDYLVVLAWLFLFCNTTIWQTSTVRFYITLESAVGIIPPPPALGIDLVKYNWTLVPIQIFFYTGLWTIKLSLLIFFRRLITHVRGLTIHLWIVTTFVVITWLITFGTIQYPCILGNFHYLSTHCISGSAINFQRHVLFYNTAMDIITDAAIITIPMHLLWNVRISLRQKVSLMGLFSLTIFVMVFAVVRATVVGEYSTIPDNTWLYMWSSIEQSVSIMIACLASFRSLFTNQDNNTTKSLNQSPALTTSSYPRSLSLSRVSWPSLLLPRNPFSIFHHNRAQTPMPTTPSSSSSSSASMASKSSSCPVRAAGKKFIAITIRTEVSSISLPKETVKRAEVWDDKCVGDDRV